MFVVATNVVASRLPEILATYAYPACYMCGLIFQSLDIETSRTCR